MTHIPYRQIKNASLALCLLVSLSSFGAIQVWTSSENVARALKQLTPKFEEDFDEEVVITVLNKDLTTQFKTAAIAGKGPDIFCWANDVVGELASSGLIEPIILPPDLKEALYSSALESFTYEGTLYGYPYDVEAIALIRNTNLRPQPFQSFEELLEWSQKYSTQETYPFLFDLKSFYFNFSFLSAGGAYIFGPTQKGGLDPTNIGLANQGAIHGVQYLKSLVEKNIVPTSSNRNVAFEKMLKGKLAVTIDGPWAIKDLKKAGIPFAVDPLPPLKGHRPRPLVGTHGFIIRRSSPQKELAKELIEKYFLTSKSLAILYQEDPRGPSRGDTLTLLKKSLAPEDLYTLKQFSENAKIGIPMPNISAMGPVWNAMGSAYELILQKDRPIEQTLLKAKEKILHSIKSSTKD